ncbi:hypothetical protein [Salipiger marinus]|uniref:hypothetical protein n=1 Tax=Salipiger marinus TaxID=555512 RepID=UPI0013F4E1DB|nr:hypothetical protein [Salipiger marinus]
MENPAQFWLEINTATYKPCPEAPLGNFHTLHDTTRGNISRLFSEVDHPDRA